MIEAVTAGSKPKDDDKNRLIMALRKSVRGMASFWLDAVVSIVGSDSNLKIELPALLGTGGNEGSGSYTSAYMAAIDQCLLKRLWDHAVASVLFGDHFLPKSDWGQSLGQFVPEGAATPWDLLLAFEGACVIRSAVSSRNTSANTRWMSSPFYVAPVSYGYASESRFDEVVMNSGKKMPGRGEQWFPLWSHPMSYKEIQQLFSEGRANTKRGPAADGWSMLLSIRSFGVRQGIREFVRYGYQQRNNMATHFAVPLGRYRVPEQRSPFIACLDDLDVWRDRLRKQARAKAAPGRLQLVERRLADSLFAVAQHPDEANRWQAVLLALADVEMVLRTGAGFHAGPIPPLRAEWVRAADDGSTEIRLALTCALQWPSVRRHWLPLNWDRFAAVGSGAQRHLEKRPEVVMNGRDGIEDAIALLGRRLVETEQKGERELALRAAKRASASVGDLGRLLAGEVDVQRVMRLALALMALNRKDWSNVPCPAVWPKGPVKWPDDAWMAIRLSFAPFPLPPDDTRIYPDPAILRRLESGDVASAVQSALQRLRARGIGVTVRASTASPQTARLWAAALAFPISKNTAAGFRRRLDPKNS